MGKGLAWENFCLLPSTGGGSTEDNGRKTSECWKRWGGHLWK